ncbi:ABC transporter substrate-binding protein [Mycobacterium sp. AMU20-3851]|uniref:ABC transporter substrate-binding protein n=1 Tax=Mycobacterium sp. AMU20-3851 TaxID=3122055 RepID=UPI0037545F02
MTRINRTLTASLAAGAVLALTLSGCSSGPSPVAGDSGLPVVRFSALPDPAPLPVLVMQEHGIDEKHGFDAEFLEVDPDVATTTFLMGESEIAVDQDAVGSTIANNEGHDVVSFYPALANTAAIVASPGSGINTPADLVGKRVGHFGMDSGTTQAISVSLREGFGIDINDFELVQSSPSSLPQLLAAGEVDAIFDYEPYGAKAIQLTGGKYVFQVTPYWKQSSGWSPALAMLTAHREWITENPDLAKNVLAAWQEAEQLVADSGYQMFLEEPYAGFLDRESTEELQALADYCAQLPCYTGEWNQGDVDQQMRYLDLLVQQGMLDRLPENPPVATLDSVIEG